MMATKVITWACEPGLPLPFPSVLPPPPSSPQSFGLVGNKEKDDQSGERDGEGESCWLDAI